MKSDYFFKKYIITTYSDYKNNLYQIDIFDKETKTTYRVTDLKIIEKANVYILKEKEGKMKKFLLDNKGVIIFYAELVIITLIVVNNL